MPTDSSIQPSSYFRQKAIADRLIAAILLMPCLPVIGLLILVTRLGSRGPGLFRQVRTGKDFRTFTMYKIRTMRSDAEAATGPVWARVHDPRITRLGRLLRKLHLDELPQLFNVLKGEMSLIGPRPERPEIVAVLKNRVPGYANRLAILPGITGLAQINLPPDTTLDDVRRKVVLDIEYIREASFWLDARILMSTSFRMLGMPGTRAMSLFKLQRPIPQVECTSEPMPKIGAEQTTESASADRSEHRTHGEATSEQHGHVRQVRKSRSLHRVSKTPHNPR